MNKHTPGPWGVSFNGKCTCDIEEISGDHRHIAGVERQQDARLIAAAPEMLEVLKNTLNGYGHTADCQRHNYVGEDNDNRYCSLICKGTRAAIEAAEGGE